RVDVEHASQHGGLLRDDTNRAAVHTGEADDDVARPLRVDLEETAAIHHRLDYQLHVIWLIRIIGDDLVQQFFGARDTIGGRLDGRVIHVVGGQVAHQQAYLAQALDLGRHG